MKISVILKSMRLRTLPLSLSGVTMGVCLASVFSAPQALTVIFLFLTTALLQVTSNLCNELGDAQHGTDASDRQGIHYSIQDGDMTIPQMKRLIACVIALCCLSGLLMIYSAFGTLFSVEATGFVLLGACAILSAIRYTVGKNPYGYRGLGDIFVFIFFGLVSTLGGFYFGALSLENAAIAILPACAIGFLSVGVLNVNNIRDMGSDARTRVTVPILIGAGKARIYQTVLIIAALILMIVNTAIFAVSPYCWLFLTTFPFFCIHLKGVWTKSDKKLDPMLPLLVVSTFALTIMSGIPFACNRADKDFVGSRTEALPSSVWQHSQWISAADAPVKTGKVTGYSNCRAADGASWFVATVKNDAELRNATWMTAGLGVYEIFANGKLVGNEILKPGFTHFAKTKASFTYDITDAFDRRAGAENTLSAQLTPGWWADKVVTAPSNDGMVGKKCAFRSVLQLTYVDGSTEYFGTDTLNWRAGIAGPVKHAAIFDGEQYDGRELPGYALADKLGRPELNSEFNGEIIPSRGAEVYLRKDLTLWPVDSYVWKEIEGADEGHYGKVVVTRTYKGRSKITLHKGETLVVDFGQNSAAVPSFLFSAAEGTHLTCLPSEILNDGKGSKQRGMDGPEGSCHRLNLRTPKIGMMLDYTFGASGVFVRYTPRCTFFGYRYLSITADADVVFREIATIPVSSITESMETGSLVTGSPLVNKLISNTIWGQRSNYLSVPTDCPQRNERQGWTADTQVFAETGSFFASTHDFFIKWMRDMRDSQSPLGAFPGVAPPGAYGSSMMRVGWADAAVIVPWVIWKQFGKTDIIEENWDAMNRFIDHVVETRYDHEAIKDECANYQWADWLSYEPLESNSGACYSKDGAVKKLRPEAVAYWNYLGASYWLIDSEMLRDMAAATGRDTSRYAEIASMAREYIHSNFINADGTFKCEILNAMQTPSLFALRNRLLEAEARDSVIARLRRNFAEHGNCLQTGFLGTSILMSTLTENGMADIAWDLLFQRRNPSWLYSVDNGATTIWERWNSYTIESGMGPKGMNSFNHYAYGCVCEWIWKTVAGIAADVRQPGFKHIIMRPIPDKRLGFVEAEYNSAAGLVKSSWRFEGDQWIWKFTIPQGSTASVTLPGSTETKEYGPGNYCVSTSN